MIAPIAYGEASVVIVGVNRGENARSTGRRDNLPWSNSNIVVCSLVHWKLLEVWSLNNCSAEVAKFGINLEYNLL